MRERPDRVPVGPADHIEGNSTAKTILVEYSDYQCPACALFYSDVKKFVTDNKDKIEFVYRNFPLSQHLNSSISAYAAEAAYAAYAADATYAANAAANVAHAAYAAAYAAAHAAADAASHAAAHASHAAADAAYAASRAATQAEQNARLTALVAEAAAQQGYSMDGT